MKKLILKCGLAPGDIVMLSAAVRDLHRCYPRQFSTDVRTACPEIWEHNPLITPLDSSDPAVTELDCAYPLINRCNKAPYHCLHGFIEFLNEHLGLSIRPTVFKGDIHLSPQEKAWYSQVHEFTREDTPFWIIAAGGKYDVTLKWWSTERYSAVVDHFRDKILFVQVGQRGHHHPKLDGTIDLRGRTNLRELIRLVYHAQGVLCPVTSLMHLAAAVETRPGRLPNRPCVVVAGGREPAHWEAYPDHQFIHTNGTMSCCAAGGCWKDRTIRLRDGDHRDHPGNICPEVHNGLPKCMDMVSAAEVCRRIELYFAGHALGYLPTRSRRGAQRGIRASSLNQYDEQSLNLHSAGLACDRFIAQLSDSASPPLMRGRGIVICGGGTRYLTSAWVCINMLRGFGCELPVELWYLGESEKDAQMHELLAPLGVECVDASAVRRAHPIRRLGGWELKPYALLHSRFQEILLLDADNVPVRNPEYLFEAPQYKETGAVFWPDYVNRDLKRALPIWRSCGLRRPKEPELESGQLLLDKACCWKALSLAVWFNANSDFYYQHLHGDKDTFHLAFRKLRQPYALIPHPIHPLPGTMCQHDFEGQRVFQHRNGDKWDLLLSNRRIEGFWFEGQCRQYVARLQEAWDGGVSARFNGSLAPQPKGRRREPKITAVMISCPEREALRARTLESLSRSDWGDAPVEVVVDRAGGTDHRKRQTRCAFNALKQALRSRPDYILFLEDDLVINRHLRHNLHHWPPIRDRTAALASLYNPHLCELACDVPNNARIMSPANVFGSQALVISCRTAEYVVSRWHHGQGMQDVRIARLAGRLQHAVFYHSPSLVQHAGIESVWGGHFHQAFDFDPEWRAGAGLPRRKKMRCGI